LFVKEHMVRSMEPVIKHFIETLNRDNGGALFEGIASTLAEKEICSNILPSTGPYGGGDKGTDARTHRTYLLESGENFRLYSSTDKSPTDKKIVFAFSIQKDWKAKLDKDCEKIIEKYGLEPDEICFITNQFIKTKAREEKINELQEKYPGVDFEIYDGEWILSRLKEKHYSLLVLHFGFPETADPRVEEMYRRIYAFREGGMTDEESVKVRDLLQRAYYRSSYNGIIEQRVIDLKIVADIQAKYTSFVEESLKNYEEALTEIKEVDDKVLVSELYYDFFRALQKLRFFNRLASWMPEYREYLIKNKRYQDYRFIFTWLMYLYPHRRDISALDLKDFVKESYELVRIDRPNEVARHIAAYYEEALVHAKQLLIFIGERQDDSLELWRNHIEYHKEIPLYPIAKLSKIVTALSIQYEGTDEYEELYALVEDLLVGRNQKFEAAQLRKDRAFNLFTAGMFDKAVRHFNIVKVQWYDHETLKGSMLSAWILNECYTNLGLYFAALQELFGLLHLTTLDENILSEHKDLFIKSLIFAYYKYLQLGMFGSAVIMGKLALLAIARYREEPKLGDESVNFGEIFHRNTAVSLVSLKYKFGEYGDRVLSLIENIDPEIVMTFKMMFEETDEEFEQGWDGAEDKLEEALKFRKQIREGRYSDIGNEDIGETIDESIATQARSFTYKDMECLIEFENSFNGKRIAEHISAYLQALLVFFFESDELAWIDNKLKIHIIFDEKTPHFQIREKPNNEEVEFDLAVNPQGINDLYPYAMYDR
jgi:hypothetical protein